uniref:FYR N-terminal domain-containing protein n=1 Tax=Macrostomum lignano TaxID=282301 RepID=A0A1I8JGG9_9PLAT
GARTTGLASRRRPADLGTAMTTFLSDAVLTQEDLTNGARIHIGDETTNGECFFRSVSWSRPGEKRRYPVVLQTKDQIELLKGLHERGSVSDHSTSPNAEPRDEVALPIFAEDFCKTLFDLLRSVERIIEIELEAKSVCKILFRATKQPCRHATEGSSADYNPVQWVPLKAAYACLGFRMNDPAHPDGVEAAPSEFKGAVTTYPFRRRPCFDRGLRPAGSSPSLYDPIVLMDRNPSNLNLFAGLRRQLAKNPTNPKRKLSTGSGEEEEQPGKKKPQTSLGRQQAKKPAAPRRSSGTKKQQQKKEHEQHDRLDAAEPVPPVKVLVSPPQTTAASSSGLVGGNRVPSKDLSYQRYLAANAAEHSSSESGESEAE